MGVGLQAWGSFGRSTDSFPLLASFLPSCSGSPFSAPRPSHAAAISAGNSLCNTLMGSSRLCSHHCKSPGTRSTFSVSSGLPITPKEAVSSPALQLTGRAGVLLSPGEAPRALPCSIHGLFPLSLLPLPYPWPFSLALLLSPVNRLVPALGGDQSWGWHSTDFPTCTLGCPSTLALLRVLRWGTWAPRR